MAIQWTQIFRAKTMVFRTPLLAFTATALVLAGCKNKTTPAGAGDARAAVVYTHIDWNTAGTVSGQVKMPKGASPHVTIDMAQDPVCGLAETNQSEQFMVAGGGLGNVFVYVKDGLGQKHYDVPQTTVVLDQVGCRYIPHVIGVMVGQRVQIQNSDATMHNVHMMPQTDGNQAMDISQPPKAGETERVFDKPELMIPVRCNNHPWMQAFINVADNPFFAVTDSTGHFSLKGLPPGTYTVVAVHEELGPKEMSVTVPEKGTAKLDFSF